jgi:valyl-tRNA synthetase
VISFRQGLYKGKEPNKMRLGVCSRSGDVLEPMITPQWYLACDGMAKRSADAVRNGELTIVPSDHEKTWFHWLDNIRDWCVSRQLWWGHQIPAWFATQKAEDLAKNDMANNDRWVVARTEEVIRLLTAFTCSCRLRRADCCCSFFMTGCAPKGCETPWLLQGRNSTRTRRGRARHVVFVWALPIFGHGLAGSDG